MCLACILVFFSRSALVFYGHSVICPQLDWDQYWPESNWVEQSNSEPEFCVNTLFMMQFLFKVSRWQCIEAKTSQFEGQGFSHRKQQCEVFNIPLNTVSEVIE